MTNTPKSCSTCEHRIGSSMHFAKCGASGYYCSTERKYPSVCGKDFEAWEPRLSVTQRFVFWIKGAA